MLCAQQFAHSCLYDPLEQCYSQSSSLFLHEWKIQGKVLIYVYVNKRDSTLEKHQGEKDPLIG